MGKIKGFLFAVRHREILMTDLGLWKLSLVQRLGKAVKLTAAIDNIFGYKPKYYYLNSPTTDGATFQIGMSIDIDKFFK